jgi:hypothetical protein
MVNLIPACKPGGKRCQTHRLSRSNSHSKGTFFSITPGGPISRVLREVGLFVRRALQTLTRHSSEFSSHTNSNR